MWSYILGLAALLQLYNSFQFFLIRRRAREPAKIITGAKPFFIKKPGKTVAFLIHGFTSNPKEMRGLADFLINNKISVSAPLLPGHGTTVERLAITKYPQWIERVQQEIKLIESKYENIILIGNSFGGNLAILAANSSPKIKGIITLATPIFFKYEKFWKIILFFLRRIKLFQKKKYYTPEYEKLIKTKAKSYDSIPLRSLVEVLKAIDKSKKELQKITVPILAIHAVHDPIIRPESAKFILENSASKNKKTLLINKTTHVFILEDKNPKIYSSILKFIQAL